MANPKQKDKLHTRERLEERIFNIKLKNTTQEVNMGKNSQFVKIIESEYATKYLECLGIEPTAKNIAVILKKYPLKNCEITAGWNNSGLYADTIQIITRKKISKREKQSDKSEISEDMLKKLNIQKISLKNIQVDEKDMIDNNDGAQQDENVQQMSKLQEADEDGKVRFHLKYNVQDIKKKY